VKPASFEYHRPHSLAEALDALARLDGDVRLLAGGQSLVPMLNLRLARPDHLIDLNDLVELDYVRPSDDGLEIGGLTRHHRLVTDPQVRGALPLLAAAADSIGHYAIRQRGTLGGSLAHADPAAQLPLLAVLLDAEIVCASGTGNRRVAAVDFFQSIMTTALTSGEIVVGVHFPQLRSHAGWGFEIFRQRQGDFAIVATAVLLALDNQGRVDELRLAIAGVAATPIRFDAVVAPFLGQIPDPAWVKALGEAVEQTCEVEDDLRIPAAFRRELARVLTGRAVAAAIERMHARSIQ
jgi:carbon-monoxide dehydrogenase medium subunit